MSKLLIALFIQTAALVAFGVIGLVFTGIIDTPHSVSAILNLAGYSALAAVALFSLFTVVAFLPVKQESPKS